MLLKELVEVNQKGNVANAVNFDMMDDPETNQDLCDSFIFNYDPKKPKLSTVGILDCLKESFHSRNQPNIHMMIQQYGKGKSHFAVVLANFFGKVADSPEVHGIVDQLEKATSGQAKVIAEKIKSYKQRQEKPHLVLCLSGDKGGDIRKQFLNVVTKELEAAGVENAIASHMCRKPLEYLEEVLLPSPENMAKADAYLENLGYPDGDVNSLIKQLRKNNPSVIRSVKDLCRHVSKVNPDFQDDINVEAILRDLLDHQCSGENAPFNGILILFDEMNYYLQSWAADQIGAGGTAIQNITNICELQKYKSKIALLSFTQIDPSKAVGISPSVRESYLKIASRLAPKDSTYDGPASSLELVIDNMLTQKEETPLWQNFLYRWDDTLLSSARDAFEKYIKTYKQRGWTLSYFYNHLSRGCFPLHPITAYLLANLSFTQDRTAIQFIKGYVSQFIDDNPVEENEQLSYIYAIDLVDTFAENFSDEGLRKRYQEARQVVLGSDNPDELKMLKALFLYFASDEKLAKGDREKHEDLLGALAGLSAQRTKVALNSLMNTRDLISYKPEIKLYRFWEGISPRGIAEEIEDRIRNEKTEESSVIKRCQVDCEFLLKDTVCVANQFVEERKLVAADWRYEIKFYTPDGLIPALSSDRTLKGTDERGILAYVMAETQEELQDLRRTIDDYLAKSPIKASVAVAIPSEETGNLAHILLKIKTLASIQPHQKRMWGTTACEQLEQRWTEEVNTRIQQILQSCSYHCIALNKVPLDKQNQPPWIVSALLQDLYPFVPSVNKIDKLRSDHPTGKKIVKSLANQLFADTLSPQTVQETSHKTVIDSVFVTSWGLLKKKTNKYVAGKPQDKNLKAAWEEIEKFAELKDQSEKVFHLIDIWKILSAPPYGYSEYNFTVLLVTWLACHRKEVMLKGPIAVKRTSTQQVAVRQQSLKEWAHTDLFENPKTFVSGWIIRDRAKLIRKEGVAVPVLPNSPVDWSQAHIYLEQANRFLESTEVEPDELVGVQRTKEKVETALGPIISWIQPVEETEKLAEAADIETLIDLYQQLRQPLPSYSLGSDVISVRPTAEQRTRHDNASQTIDTRIEQYTEQVSLQSENLESSEACDDYQAKVQSLINTFEQTPGLPDHLKEILQNSLRVAQRVRDALKQNTQIKNLLETAKAKANTLHDYSTQTEFTQTVDEIKPIQQQIPASRPEAEEVQQLLRDIDRQYQDLNQKLDTWEERLTSATTHKQIVTLLQETAKHDHRFTESDSRERLDQLKKKLNHELSGIESKSQTEKLLKAELDNARQPLQRLRDLPDARIVEAFQAYQALKEFQFTPVDNAELLQQYQERLEEFKTQGTDQLTQKFQQICNRKLSRLELYDSRKEALQRSLDVLDADNEFDAIKQSLTQCLAELESQADNLRTEAECQRQQAEDKETIKEIRQLRPNQNSSIHTCEESINQIQTLQTKLHEFEQFQAEVSQVLQACQTKIQSYEQQLTTLREHLDAVKTSEDLSQVQLSHVRLESAFRDSTRFAAYEAVGTTIDDIKGDLQTLDKLQDRYQQVSSIAACSEILEDLAQSQDLLKYPDRFRESHLNLLEESTTQKIQAYQQELTQIEQQLNYVSTPAEIQKLEQELIKQSSCYTNSAESKRVEQLTREINTLVELIPLTDITKAANLEACNRQVKDLKSWQDSSDDISQLVQDRVNTALEELEQRQQKLLIEKQKKARSWLKQLESKTSKMFNAIRESQKYNLASEILQLVYNSRNEHITFLDTTEQKRLRDVERQCLEEQNKNVGNQIITMFKQLPRAKREALYKHLEQYLVEQTEADLSTKSEERWWQRLFHSDNQKTNQND